MKVEEISESVEVTQRLRYLREMVVTKIEHPEPLQTADLFGHFGQLVVSQDQSLQLGLLPHVVWHAAELLLPKIQVLRKRLLHTAILPQFRDCERITGKPEITGLLPVCRPLAH
jgi:hypothetical protein